MTTTRVRMTLHLKNGQLDRDLGKAPGTRLTEANLALEKSKGGVYGRVSRVCVRAAIGEAVSRCQ